MTPLWHTDEFVAIQQRSAQGYMRLGEAIGREQLRSDSRTLLSEWGIDTTGKT